MTEIMEKLFTFFTLAFLVLIVFSIINPNVGGIWMNFLKKKTRLKTVGINFLMMFISLIFMAAFSESDYYQMGKKELGNKNYPEAISYFEKADQEEFEGLDKKSYIDKIKKEAEDYYQEELQKAKQNLDLPKILAINRNYNQIFHQDLIKEDELKQTINLIKKEIEKFIKQKKYQEAEEKLDALSYIENEKDYINKIQEKLKDLKEKEKIISYKNQAKSIKYSSLLRTPDKYMDEIVVFKGQVMQKITPNEFLVNTHYEPYLDYFSGDTIYIVTNKKLPIIEDDIIKIYGEFKGLYSYTTIAGVENEVPHINAEIIEIIEKR